MSEVLNIKCAARALGGPRLTHYCLYFCGVLDSHIVAKSSQFQVCLFAGKKQLNQLKQSGT